MAIDPIRNLAAYRDIRVADRAFPGIILDIRGLESTEEWTTTRAIASSNWTQVHRGRVPIDKIEIDIGLDGPSNDQSSAAWRAWYQFILYIRGGVKPPIPKKPPTLGIRGAMFAGAGVEKVVYMGHVEPIYRTSRNVGTIRFKEAAKSTPLPVEPPEPAILNETNPIPRTAAEAQLDAASRASFGDAPADRAGVISERYPGVGAWGTP